MLEQVWNMADNFTLPGNLSNMLGIAVSTNNPTDEDTMNSTSIQNRRPKITSFLKRCFKYLKPFSVILAK